MNTIIPKIFYIKEFTQNLIVKGFYKIKILNLTFKSYYCTLNALQ